jgi:hypothetical protein
MENKKSPTIVGDFKVIFDLYQLVHMHLSKLQWLYPGLLFEQFCEIRGIFKTKMVSNFSSLIA